MTNRERLAKERNSSRRNKRILKRLLLAAILALVLCTGVSCANSASFKRFIKSTSSDFGGGLDRTVNVYSYTGELINTYSGKFDIETSDQKVFFDLDGKRVIIYNALVIAEEN